MTKLNQLLRQAARITAGVDPNTDRATTDHEGDAAYVTALAGEKKASRKRSDTDPNTPRSEGDHEGDAAYETALDPKVSSRKKAEFGAEEFPAAEEKAEDFGGETDEPCEGEACEDSGLTNADMVEALEDVKQGIMDAKVEAGDSPVADLLTAIEDVIEAVDQIQDAVSQDAMEDPAAKEAFKTASNFKNFFIKERNIKAAKAIRQHLSSVQNAQPKKAAATKKSNLIEVTLETREKISPKSILDTWE